MAKDKIIRKPKLKAYSVITATVINATEATYSTYGGRKFSDYDLLVFNVGTSAIDIRGSLVLHTSDWFSGCTFHITSAHGASLGNVSSVDATYASDTSIKMRTGGANAFNYVWCLGYRVE